MTAPDRIWMSNPDEENEVAVWFHPDDGGTEYIRADLATPAAMTPEVAKLVEAARKARDGLQWAQVHLNEAGMKSLSVDVGLMKIDAALAALAALTQKDQNDD